MPAPASTPATSSANSADRCRASHPTTTGWAGLRAAPLRAESGASSQPATAAVAARTTARFIRFGPAATTPRSPAVPKCSRSANRSRNSATAPASPATPASASSLASVTAPAPTTTPASVAAPVPLAFATSIRDAPAPTTAPASASPRGSAVRSPGAFRPGKPGRAVLEVRRGRLRRDRPRSRPRPPPAAQPHPSLASLTSICPYPWSLPRSLTGWIGVIGRLWCPMDPQINPKARIHPVIEQPRPYGSHGRHAQAPPTPTPTPTATRRRRLQRPGHARRPGHAKPPGHARYPGARWARDPRVTPPVRHGVYALT